MSQRKYVYASRDQKERSKKGAEKEKKIAGPGAHRFILRLVVGML